MTAKHLKVSDFSNVLKSSTIESERALWFLSYMLFAMEQLLVTNTKWKTVDAAWENTVGHNWIIIAIFSSLSGPSGRRITDGR